MNRKSNLYPVWSVAACDGNFCRKKEGEFLLRDRFWSLPVCSFDFLDGLLEKKKKRNNRLHQKLSLLRAEASPAAPTMFLKVAHVLLLDVLCSRMAVLLISSPTLSLHGVKKAETFRQCNSSNKFIVRPLWNVAIFHHDIYVFHSWRKRQPRGSCIIHGFKYMNTDFNG